MRPYLDISFVLRPGWARVTSLEILDSTIIGETGRDLVDPKRWPNAPHVAFANLNVTDMKTLAMFTRLYGPPTADITKIPAAGDRFEVDYFMVGRMRERVRFAWRAKDAKELWLFENVERYDMPFTVSGKKLQLAPADVFTYIRLLLTRDISENRARICANPNCPSPYFIYKRRDQKFCEHKCASLIMVQRDRERKRRAK
jgi:hypothetical protein